MTREEKVLVFQKRMLQLVSNDPNSTSLKDRQLAVKLIFEELKELSVALSVEKTMVDLCIKVASEGNETVVDDVTGITVDPLEVIDAFCDIEYTCLWGVNTTGLSKDYDKAFDEVCRSNNSKDCETKRIALETKEKYDKEGFVCELKLNEFGRYVVVDQHGKVKKSINYSKADLKPYVTKQLSN